MNGWTLVPEHGPPRLLRFREDMPDTEVAILDEKNNLVHINKRAWEACSVQQRLLIETTRSNLSSVAVRS